MRIKIKLALLVLVLVFFSLSGRNTIHAQIATSGDWIGIFAPNDPDPILQGNSAVKPAYDWKYVDCDQTLAGPPTNYGDCVFTMPSTPGNYEFRMYANDTNVRMGTYGFSVIQSQGFGGTLCPIAPRAEGLISTQEDIEGFFGNFTGQCITNPQALYVPFKIPTYDELKTIFYIQIRTDSNKVKHPTISGDKSQTDIPFDGSLDHVYNLSDDLNISGNAAGPKSGVVFVDGDLRFTQDYTYGTGTTGTVFVVKGNISIDATVKTIGAVLISEGIICTSTPATGMLNLNQDCSGLVASGTNNLTVNGNLVSLSQTIVTPIRFRRNLADNYTGAAERVNLQPKYFVILRHLFSQTLQITTEVN
ncbi:hypothetical protein A3E66_05030 [Candidatus Daviesbacteria bacterium RIFCSPHIGHO2_12_FULL_37_16]|uniref:Uncharacterized protein n=1 Tax=Candidatus Daviesbacteria bacterium RIFCSPHIGHO2_12_FULL_37_16 TaxID=1797778 RepID=A0A1F5K5A1_9BACT|nr:MAG: hypothetical protein A3E66_05030 [Candidatus Daviesbacteria bacterium RIFCSPHIGHO2_12_FULL_37_16]